MTEARGASSQATQSAEAPSADVGETQPTGGEQSSPETSAEAAPEAAGIEAFDHAGVNESAAESSAEPADLADRAAKKAAPGSSD